MTLNKLRQKPGRWIIKIPLILIGTLLFVCAIYVSYVLFSYRRIPDQTELKIINAQTMSASDSGQTHSPDPSQFTSASDSGQTHSPDPSQFTSASDSGQTYSTGTSQSSAPTDTNETLTATSDLLQINTDYSIVTFNAGFGAYTPDYSFFMDGGKSSWAASKESVIETISGAAHLLGDLDADITLLQEVDLNSTRSYHVNQLDYFAKGLSLGNFDFAINYDSPFLFYPFTEPHGKSLSGIGTFSVFPITSAVRRSLPIAEGFSKFLDLDRCYSVSRMPVANGAELIIYNVHLSAYGNSDEVREGQKKMLLQDMAGEAAAGNYVICGGDFNHDLMSDDSSIDNVIGWAYPFLRSYIPEGISLCVDLLSDEERTELVPTCRDAKMEYCPEDDVYYLDGFFISDNVECLSYETIDTGFAYSDHNPVRLVFKLK